MKSDPLAKSMKRLERVKGIEPSYSAWKAAALPLSYTRARPINYHGRQAASTAMSGFGPLGRPCKRPLFPRRPSRPAGGPVDSELTWPFLVAHQMSASSAFVVLWAGWTSRRLFHAVHRLAAERIQAAIGMTSTAWPLRS